MSIRLNKVTRDLNVGIQTVATFLRKKGFEIELNPNTKITDEQYNLLVKEFSTDKDLKNRIGTHQPRTAEREKSRSGRCHQ